ncbi:MAG: hypothetical protein WC924_03175 [Candidatus Gracilibacteria bacterium]
MINSIESGLLEDIPETRKLEMDRYGRTKIYDQISTFLQGDRQIAFSLVNHALAIVDDEIDSSGNEVQLNRAKEILNQGFQGQEAEITETWGHNIYILGQTLSRLHDDGFVHAAGIFDEIINYWEIEKQNIDRKEKVLPSVELDDLSLKIGKSIGIQFLYLLCPDLAQESRESIATSYGFAIKLADNLSDLQEDFEQGYVNISRENIEKYHLNISDLNEGNLKSYRKTEFGRIKQYYEEGDKIVDEISERYPSQKKGILIFKDIAHSWLKQVSDETQENNEDR